MEFYKLRPELTPNRAVKDMWFDGLRYELVKMDMDGATLDAMQRHCKGAQFCIIIENDISKESQERLGEISSTIFDMSEQDFNEFWNSLLPF